MFNKNNTFLIMDKKLLYASPECEVVELGLEGTVLTGSERDPNFNPTYSGWGDENFEDL